MHLVNLVIKHKSMVILGHEDDRDNSENFNLHLHDYKALGLKLSSLQSMYFAAFLSYKPEHMFLENSDDDLEIVLRAMSKEIAPLGDFTVLIEDDKFKYLTSEKLGKLGRAGVAGLTKSELGRGNPLKASIELPLQPASAGCPRDRRVGRLSRELLQHPVGVPPRGRPP